ncbi:hypothetical protein [Mycobacteroides abscessus]|nr:hypothetical protein [Mycobacteroides abscessus]
MDVQLLGLAGIVEYYDACSGLGGLALGAGDLHETHAVLTQDR